MTNTTTTTTTNSKFYTEENMKAGISFLNMKVEEIISSIYSLEELTSVKVSLEKELGNTLKQKLHIKMQFPALKKINFNVPKDTFKAQLTKSTKEEVVAAYNYYNLNRKQIAISAILDSGKLHNIIRKMLIKLFNIALQNKSNKIQLDQVLNSMKLKITSIKINNKEIVLNNKQLNTIKLQLIYELARIDILDISVTKGTNRKYYTVSIPKVKMDKITQEELDYLFNLSCIIKYNTILVEPAKINNKMTSQSSWYYSTPELSEQQKEFIDIMHNTKWKFVPNAEELVEEAYRLHLAPKDRENAFELPGWAYKRIEEFKRQIRASNANGGHYIRGMFDSALRWYWQAGIGHIQLSEQLRNLVTIADTEAENVVKYDMTNSVVQMYALGLRDKTLGSYVGLTSQEDRRRDLRTIIADSMNKTLNITSFTKDNVKPLFMVWAYNGGRERLTQDEYSEEITDFFTGETARKIKREGLMTIARRGNSNLDEITVWDTFIGILNRIVPSIVELKEFYSKLIAANPFTESKWTLPDGAVAQYAAVQTVEDKIHWIDVDGKEHQHTAHTKVLVKGAGNAGLLPRVIHSLDAYVMRQTIIRCKASGFTVIPNHDAFMFGKEHTEKFMDILKEVFIEIMEQNVLANIFKQINYNKTRINVKVSERIPLTREDILRGNPVKQELG